MKRHLLLMMCIGLSYQALNAEIRQITPAKSFEGSKTYKETGIGFELMNKSKSSFWIVVSNGGKLVKIKVPASTPQKRASVQLKLDIKQPTSLGVWKQDPGNVKDALQSAGYTVFKPRAQQTYYFVPYKTIYVTWDTDGFPRPQTGPGFGLFGKTESGLSLENNVTKDDINSPKHYKALTKKEKDELADFGEHLKTAYKFITGKEW